MRVRAAVSRCHRVRLAAAWCGWLCRMRVQVCRRTLRLLVGRVRPTSAVAGTNAGPRWSHDTSSAVAREPASCQAVRPRARVQRWVPQGRRASGTWASGSKRELPALNPTRRCSASALRHSGPARHSYGRASRGPAGALADRLVTAAEMGCSPRLPGTDDLLPARICRKLASGLHSRLRSSHLRGFARWEQAGNAQR